MIEEIPSRFEVVAAAQAAIIAGAEEVAWNIMEENGANMIQCCRCFRAAMVRGGRGKVLFWPVCARGDLGLIWGWACVACSRDF